MGPKLITFSFLVELVSRLLKQAGIITGWNRKYGDNSLRTSVRHVS